MKRKLLFTLIIVILIAVIGVAFIIFHKNDSYPGDVIGENSRNIPKSKLPICEFDGVRFTIEPCYSPPGSTYL